MDKYLKWDSTSSYFSFNDDVDLGGNEIKNVRIDNKSSTPLCDSSSVGQIYHNTTDNKTYICNGALWDMLENSAITGVNSNSFTVDQDDTGGDVTLQFGTTLAEMIQWDSTNNRFYISDGAQFDGHLIPSDDAVYDLGTETLRWRRLYVKEGLEFETGDLHVAEGGLSVNLTNGETGTGNTILAGHVVEIDVDEDNAVDLTNSQNDQPIGVATNDSAYGEEVSVVMIGKTTVKCTGTIDRGDLVQTSGTDGAVKAGASSTKIVGTALSACSGGTLTAIVHLE